MLRGGEGWEGRQEGVAEETQKEKMLPKMGSISDSGTHSNVTETSSRSLSIIFEHMELSCEMKMKNLSEPWESIKPKSEGN